MKSVSIYDMQGKLMQTAIINGKEKNVSKLPKGVYVLTIQTETGKSNVKLVKE